MIFYISSPKSLEHGQFFNEDSLDDVLNILGRTVGDLFDFVCYRLPDNYHLNFAKRESIYKDLIFLRYLSSEDFKAYFVPYKKDE